MENNLNMDFFMNRATVRRFDSKPVDPAVIKALVEAAAHAPNTGNMQLYSVVVTTSEEGLKRLAPLHFNQPAATGAPVLLTVCADIRRFGEWCEAREAHSGLENFGGWLSAITDAAIFAQQLVTAAEADGLGACFLGTATYNVDGFREALGLPEGVLPLVGISLGYPAEKPEPSDRLPVEAILHEERYHDATPEDIDRWYARKEEFEASAGFIEENGKKTLAQVYSEVRYPRALNEQVGTAVLRNIGQPPSD